MERKKWRGEVAEALVVWKKEDKERKQRNVKCCARYKKAMAMWEKACDTERSKPRKHFTQAKPTQEKLEGHVPRPKISVAEDEDEEDVEEDEENNKEEE